MYADYSAAKLTGAALRAAGFTGAIRYAGTPGRTKNTTPAEVASLRAAGLDVHAVYENSTSDFTGGYNAGVANARALLADATACGITGVLFMSADQHLTSSQLPQWKAYLQGAMSVLGNRIGAYGFSEAIVAAKAVGVPHLWQCGSKSALVTGANFWQRNTGTTTVSGVQVDINDVITPLANSTLEVPDVNLTDPIPTAVLDANGNYASDGPSASVQDILRFADASVRWLIEHWVPAVNDQLSALKAGQAVTLTTDQFTELTKDVASAVSSAVGTLELPGVSDADKAAIAKACADATVSEFATRIAA